MCHIAAALYAKCLLIEYHPALQCKFAYCLPCCFTIGLTFTFFC